MEINEISDLPIPQVLSAYDLLADVLFWIKDRSGRIIHANGAYLEHVGASSVSHVIGKTDFDFLPEHLAKQYFEDDKRLVARGEPVLDRLELNQFNNTGVSWFSTSKKPIYNANNEIIGLLGTSRHLQSTSISLTSLKVLKEPITFIRRNYDRDIAVQDIAEAAYLSVSALERRFKKHLQETPKQYLTSVRLEQARRQLIETERPINTISIECGFHDHSYFCKRFKLRFDQLPSECRAKNKHTLSKHA